MRKVPIRKDTPMKKVELKDVAESLKLDMGLVRDALSERPGINITKDEQDRIFQTARKMGYDLKKLKLGKRLNLRQEIIGEILSQIETNAKWKRKEIVEYLKRSAEMVDRVRKRTFIDEFDWL
ncbi:MAG: hypothetical protein WC980_05505 [Candidatus Brocadiia bacterium]